MRAIGTEALADLGIAFEKPAEITDLQCPEAQPYSDQQIRQTCVYPGIRVPSGGEIRSHFAANQC